MIKIGILNGFVDNPNTERPCTEYAIKERPSIWKDYFEALTEKDSSQRKFLVKEISVFEIDIDYAIVLNPFGETYPEHDFEKKSSYQIIKTFIEDGGLFANTAGFPFVYGWDVHEGKQKPITELYLMFPQSFRIEGSSLRMEQVKQLIGFAGTLFWKEFRAVTTSDIQGHFGGVEEQAYQKSEDKEKFGDLLESITAVKEFRALGKQTPNAVPIVRSECKAFGDGEVWPIASVKYENGYIITSGMFMDELHCNLFARAINSFSDWFAKQYT